MSKELDNLFRKKLDGYKAEPTPAAWEEIESSLHPDRISWKFYVSIAASLALIIFISIYVFMPKQDVETGGTEQLAQVEENTPVETNTIETNTIEETTSEETVKNESEAQPKVQEQIAQQNVTTQNSTVASAPTEVNTETTDQLDERIMASLEIANGFSNTTSDPQIAPVAFSGQKVAVAQPEIAEPAKKGINLKKVLDLAKDLKTDNESWGTLREAKNELLSFGKKKVESSDD